MKILICFIALMSLSVRADDDPTAPVAAAATNSRADSLRQLEAALTAAKTQETNIKTAITNAERKIREARQKIIDAGAGGPALTRSERASLQAQIDNSKDDLDTAKRQLESTREDIDGKQQSLEEAQGSGAPSAADVARTIRELKALYRGESASGRFTKLDSRVLNVRQQLEVLERLYDQTKVGAYVREKLERAFNPNNLCKMTAACAGGAPGALDEKANEPTVEGLFFDKKGDLGRKRGEEGSH